MNGSTIIFSNTILRQATEEERLRLSNGATGGICRRRAASPHAGLLASSHPSGEGPGKTDRDAFNTALEEINRRRNALQGRVVVVKAWLHMAEEKAHKRLAQLREANGVMRRATVIEWGEIKGGKQRARLNEAALDLVEKTSTGYAPWAVIAADDAHYRDAAVAELLLRTLERANTEIRRRVRQKRLRHPSTSACRAPALYPR